MIDRFDGDNRWLSNFWMCPVKFEGITYPSSEHAYQAAKAQDRRIRDEIRKLDSPGKAKRAGSRIALRPDWEFVKLQVMFHIVYDKFSRNLDLKEKLLATNNMRLVESNTWGDIFWGVCNGIGENNLGKILMQVRKELKKAR